MSAKVLILKHDVINRKPDRRKKRDGWSRPVWKRGMRWSLDSFNYAGDDPIEGIQPLGCYGGHKPWHSAMEYGLSLADFDVRKATTWKDVATEEGNWHNLADDVLEVLVRREAVSLEELRSTLRFVLDRPEEGA